MARCNCNPGNVQCLSPNAGNLLSYDVNGCLFASYNSLAVFGQQSPTVNFDLVPVAESVWHDTGLSVTLPSAGTYEVVADVSLQAHIQLVIPAPPTAGVSALRLLSRIFNATDNTTVPGSLRLVTMVGASVPGNYVDAGAGSSRTIITVNGPKTIRLDAEKLVTRVTGATINILTTTAMIAANTSMFYKRLA